VLQNCRNWREDSRMRILWDFTFASNGGALASLEDFIAFVRDNHDLKHEHVVLTSIPVRADELTKNTKMLHIPCRNPLMRLVNFIFGLQRIVKEENIDYVIYPGGLPNPFVAKPFAFFVRQALYFCEALKQMPLKSRVGFGLRKEILKFVAKRADVIFVQTDFMKERVQSFFRPSGQVVKIVWSVINDALIPNVRNRRKCEDERLKFLYVSLPNGRPYKNHLNLLRGLRLALDMGLDAEMILTCPRIGESRDKVVLTIHREIEKLMLDNNVILTGKLSREATLALYDKADIFVFPSICESFGVPLLEAMAYGMPILASNLDVFREVTNEACLFFDSYNPNDIAKVLVNSLAVREELSRKSKEVYRSLYSGKTIWEAVYDSISQVNK